MTYYKVVKEHYPKLYVSATFFYCELYLNYKIGRKVMPRPKTLAIFAFSDVFSANKWREALQCRNPFTTYIVLEGTGKEIEFLQKLKRVPGTMCSEEIYDFWDKISRGDIETIDENYGIEIPSGTVFLEYFTPTRKVQTGDLK